MIPKSLLNIFPGKPKYVEEISNPYKRKVDQKLIDQLVKFIKSSVHETSQIGLNKVVVGLSGGVDSSVACALAKNAFGKKALAVIVDFGDKKNFSKETKFSIEVAKKIGIQFKVIKAGLLFDEHLKLLGKNNLLIQMHLRTRFIHMIIFDVADHEFAAVIDTSDKSERLLGRYAEYFYGHFAPFYDLYKTEVYDLAKLLKLPNEVLENPGCIDLLDIDAFGVSWQILDPIIYLLGTKTVTVEKLAKSYNIDKVWLVKIKNRLDKQHLRLETKKLNL